MDPEEASKDPCLIHNLGSVSVKQSWQILSQSESQNATIFSALQTCDTWAMHVRSLEAEYKIFSMRGSGRSKRFSMIRRPRRNTERSGPAVLCLLSVTDLGEHLRNS